MENLTRLLSQIRDELGISVATAIIILIALYFIIKWAVRKGVKEAYMDITGEKINYTKINTEINNNNHIEE